MSSKTEPQNGKKKNKYFPLILGIVVVIGVVFGISKYLHSLHHEETDDAQIEGNISPVISKATGYVKKVFVDDNQRVSKGDTLVLLEDDDYQLKVMQAEAEVENAKATLDVVKATYNVSKANQNTSLVGISAAEANIEAAKVNLWKANQDYKRYANLVKEGSITEEKFEQAKAAKESAERQLKVLEQQKGIATGQSKASKSQTNVSQNNVEVAESVVKMKEAELDMAKLQLSYTAITAQTDGIVSKKNVQIGQLVQAGQSLFALVIDKDRWVVANFKETQLEKMKPGQKVSLKIDAYPGEDFNGVVESISPATGAKFSLLPPDNATGNFVKVVQRVPVKITIDESDENLKKFIAGMNVVVDVHLN